MPGEGAHWKEPPPIEELRVPLIRGNAPPGNLFETDPTSNVVALVEAAIRRIDDLRDAESAFTNSQISHLKEVASLRAEYDNKLRLSETARIDAIRAVDVGAVNRAAEVSAQQATTLANQVATSAETLRGQVEAARLQTAQALGNALEPIQKDIQELRKAQYEQQGLKGAGTDTTLEAIRELQQARFQAAGDAGGRAEQNVERKSSSQINLQAIALFVAFVAVAISVYLASAHK